MPHSWSPMLSRPLIVGTQPPWRLIAGASGQTFYKIDDSDRAHSAPNTLLTPSTPDARTNDGLKSLVPTTQLSPPLRSASVTFMAPSHLTAYLHPVRLPSFRRVKRPLLPARPHRTKAALHPAVASGDWIDLCRLKLLVKKLKMSARKLGG